MSKINALHEYPFAPSSMFVNGYKLSFLDEGEGHPVVMVHGNPTWSYMYRNLALRLRDKYRVIAPDHIGCGLSAKPRSYRYELKNHVDNLETLLDGLHIKKCVLVVHDWGGAIGMGWAGRHPERVAGVVVLNTAAFRSQRIPLRIAVCRLPYVGAFLVRGLNAFAGAAVSMAVTKRLDSRIAKGFLHPYDSWHNRVAVHGFVRDIPLEADHPSYPELTRIENNLTELRDKPMLICWGGRDFCFDRNFYEEWQERFPEADSHYFPDAGHYLLEDAFDDVAPLIENFLHAREW